VGVPWRVVGPSKSAVSPANLCRREMVLGRSVRPSTSGMAFGDVAHCFLLPRNPFGAERGRDARAGKLRVGCCPAKILFEPVQFLSAFIKRML